jgi:virulence-associated protein VagC
MITLDLRQRAISLDEILNAADQDTVVLIRRDGKRLVLEPEDAFAQEVATLGQSEAFMGFLAERAKSKGGRSLDDFERTLEAGAPATTDNDKPIEGA